MYGKPGFNPCIGKIPWRRKRLPTPVFWLGELHELYSPWVTKSRTQLSNFHFHFQNDVQGKAAIPYIHCFG